METQAEACHGRKQQQLIKSIMLLLNHLGNKGINHKASGRPKTKNICFVNKNKKKSKMKWIALQFRKNI